MPPAGIADLPLVCAPAPFEAVPCRVWEGRYSEEDHLVQQLHMLNDYVSDPTDWVVAADVDEFQWWGGKFIK